MTAEAATETTIAATTAATSEVGLHSPMNVADITAQIAATTVAAAAAAAMIVGTTAAATIAAAMDAAATIAATTEVAMIATMIAATTVPMIVVLCMRATVRFTSTHHHRLSLLYYRLWWSWSFTATLR